MGDAARIFVSHSRKDTGWTRPFVAALRQVGANVWYDEHDLAYGRLSQDIERELRARPIFIAVLSPAAVASDWVQRETEAAIHLQHRDSNRIVLLVVAVKVEVPLMWVAYRRISGPGDGGLTPAEAVGRVVYVLGIQPPASWRPSVRQPVKETAKEARDRGYRLWHEERYWEALVAFERAVELDPTYLDARDALSSLLRKLGRYEEALAIAERTLELDPEDAAARFDRQDALLQLDRLP